MERFNQGRSILFGCIFGIVIGCFCLFNNQNYFVEDSEKTSWHSPKDSHESNQIVSNKNPDTANIGELDWKYQLKNYAIDHKSINRTQTISWIKNMTGISDASEYDSIFYKVDIEQELEDSVIGNILQPLSNIRNPCWIGKFDDQHVYETRLGLYRNPKSLENRMADRFKNRRPLRMRCYPAIFLIGVSKSGTTDLAACIREHPLIQSRPKAERRWWNRIRVGHLAFGRTPNISFGGYLDSYDFSSDDILQKALQVTNDVVPDLIYDSTPHYLWDYDGWQRIPGNRGLAEPRYILPHVLRVLNPTARYIAILRNPTERLYSQYRMLTPKGSTQIFHDLCVDALARWRNCTAAFTERACAYNGSLIPHEYTRNHGGITLRASFYYPFIKDWLEVVPRGHLHIVRGEDYYADRPAALLKIFSFLGLPDLYKEQYDEIDTMTVKNARSGHKHRSNEPMLPATMEMLDNFFKESKHKLANLLNDTSFLWMR